MSKKAFFKGTFLLTCAGLLSRVIGFFYRIFLSHAIGAEGIGLFQLAIPLQTLLLAVTSSGIQTALSRLVAAHLATGEDKKPGLFLSGDFFCLCTFLCSLCPALSAGRFFCCADLKGSTHGGTCSDPFFQYSLCHAPFLHQQLLFAVKNDSSGLQLIEQIVRVGSSYLLYLVCISEGTPVTAMIAAGGTLVSELVVAVLALLMISLHFQKYAHKIFHIELPFCLSEGNLPDCFPCDAKPPAAFCTRRYRGRSDPTATSDVWAFRFGIHSVSTGFLQDWRFRAFFFRLRSQTLLP